MSKLKSAELREISRECGVNEKGIDRILGSVIVPQPESTVQNSRNMELGIRINEVLPIDHSSLMLLAKIIREYSAACPLAVGWIARGDFNPLKPPREMDRGKLLHACRTAGRLRSKFMRTMGNNAVVE